LTQHTPGCPITADPNEWLEQVPFVVGDRYSGADITALVTVDSPKRSSSAGGSRDHAALERLILASPALFKVSPISNLRKALARAHMESSSLVRQSIRAAAAEPEELSASVGAGRTLFAMMAINLVARAASRLSTDHRIRLLAGSCRAISGYSRPTASEERNSMRGFAVYLSATTR